MATKLAKPLSAKDAARALAVPRRAAGRVGDTALGAIRLNGRTMSAGLRSRVTDMEVEQTIDGASTVTMTVRDSDRVLQRKGMWAAGARIVVDGLPYVLVAVDKNEDDFTATFEDAAIWAFRQRFGPVKARRTASMTRAKFIAQLASKVKSPKVKLWSPQRDKPQKVAKSTGGSATPEPYEFLVEGGPDKEDYWSAIRRLADEVQWRAFIRANVLFVASDETLLADAPRWNIREADRGVESIDWTADVARAQQATVAAHASRWSAGAGDVVSISGSGPANGLWIVESIRRQFTSTLADIALVRPQRALPEPAPSGSTRDVADTSVAGGPSPEGAPAAVVAAYRKAEALAAKRMWYVWSSADCSWWVSQMLMAAGVLSGRLDTYGLLKWGVPGEGEWMTVWVSTSHTYLEFRGFPHRWTEAQRRGTINGWRTGKDPRGSGMVPRHASGT